MEVFINDEGWLMDHNDFVPYVIMKIKEAKKNGGNWENILTAEFWGDSLIEICILNEIKEIIKK